MGGLSWQTTLEKLREYFGQFGSVTDVLVMKDPVTQVRMEHFHEYQTEANSLKNIKTSRGIDKT